MCDQNYLNFLHESGNLKSTERTGWKRRFVPNFESVADHSWRMSLISMTFFDLPKNVDRNLAIKMSIIHDLPECKVGDLVTGIDIDEKSKHEKERSALNSLCSNLRSDDLKNIYNEYEERKTATAKFVKDLDRLEMACQAFEYQKKYGIKLTNEFYQSVRGKFYFKEVEKYFIELEAKNYELDKLEDPTQK